MKGCLRVAFPSGSSPEGSGPVFSSLPLLLVRNRTRLWVWVMRQILAHSCALFSPPAELWDGQ